MICFYQKVYYLCNAIQLTMKNKAPFGCIASRPIHGQLDSLCGHLGLFNMKEIKLTQGRVALIDDEDYDFLNQWKWCAVKIRSAYYATRSMLSHNDEGKLVKKTTQMHRLIMNVPNGMDIDHINHNGLDNRKENLRIVTRRENMWNLIKQNKYIGAYKNNNKYAAKIWVNGKRLHLGTFNTQEEAHEFYLKKAIEHKN
jgi:hypothetical protein